ncbi:MAG: DUF4956 domain-containing protein [Bacteroidia bacterium]|nr:DUF4956 domain-containing protein [Bacteroidia bacterium]
MWIRNIFLVFIFSTTLISYSNTGLAQHTTCAALPTLRADHVTKADVKGISFQFKQKSLNMYFFAALLIDIIFMFILIRLIYFPIYQKKDFFFTFFLFNILVFIITYLFNNIELSTGAAFGIFAVFSLLRFRTEDISTKDMTYLFIVIALGLVDSIVREDIIDVLIINSIVVVVAYIVDGSLFIKNEMVQSMQYGNLEMIKPENLAALKEDLKNLTGLNIHKITINKVDFVKNSVSLKVYYFD